MTVKPPERPPSKDSVEVGSDGEERRAPGERVGPLAIARHVKDDGRALILYSRIEPDSP
jgi:hypothetical protein